MMVSDKGLKCRKCGYISTNEGAAFVSSEKRRKREIPVIEEGVEGVLPTTETKCPRCGYNIAYWWLRQLRSADESEVRFFRCTKCGKTWREYD
jgi:DNA-directed RNA polymerase subunit M